MLGSPRNPLAANGTTRKIDLPSASLECNEDAPTLHMIKREAGLVAQQIRWVEDCRMVGTEFHDKREES